MRALVRAGAWFSLPLTRSRQPVLLRLLDGTSVDAPEAAAVSTSRRVRNHGPVDVKAVSPRRSAPLYAAFQGGPKYASSEVTLPTRTRSRRRGVVSTSLMEPGQRSSRPIRIDAVSRFEAPLTGTWTTTRQDDAAQAYRLTTPGGRLDGAGEYGRRWAAPRRWRLGKGVAHSPHTLEASAHISVSVRRPTLASAGSRRARGGSASKARLLQALQANNQVSSLRLGGL